MKSTSAADSNALPAHALWVELSTRITTQQLSFRSGDEETAARSIYSLFATGGPLIAAHPKASAFYELAMRLLNGTLRPYTACWHGWMVPDPVIKDHDGQPLLQFRQELSALQPLLLNIQQELKAMVDNARS